MTLASERELYAPVLLYMERCRWIGAGSIVAEEIPLSGRRIDCAVLTRSGRLLSIEFKLTDVGRVLWQATLNTHFFDRSIVALRSRASAHAIERARLAGVEIISRSGSKYTRVCSSDWERPPRAVRDRVIAKVQDRGVCWGDYVRQL